MSGIAFTPALPFFLAGISILMLIGSLVLTPRILLRLPASYFQHRHHAPLEQFQHRPLLRIILVILKNVAGGLLFLTGLTMLVLPGQGLLTLFLALLLLDFPGKNALKNRLFRIHQIREWMNHYRIRHHCPPFED